MLFFFFFNDTATTEIYTLSLHDALPISRHDRGGAPRAPRAAGGPGEAVGGGAPADAHLLRPRDDARGRLLLGDRELQSPHRRADRKSTRLNSSHANISYAVFCLKKKNK